MAMIRIWLSVVPFASQFHQGLLSIYCVPDAQFNEPVGTESITVHKVLLRGKCVSLEAERENSSLPWGGVSVRAPQERW